MKNRGGPVRGRWRPYGTGPCKIDNFLTINVDTPTKEFLQLIAAHEKISMSELCRRLLEESLNRLWAGYKEILELQRGQKKERGT
jgi:hypothetical protein